MDDQINPLSAALWWREMWIARCQIHVSIKGAAISGTSTTISYRAIRHANKAIARYERLRIGRLP